MPRGIDTTLQAALNSATVSGLVYLVRITLKTQILYWAERTVFYGGQTYAAILKNISQIKQESGDTGEVEITVANVDQAITDLDFAESFIGGKVEILEMMEVSNGTSTGSNSSSSLHDTSKTWVSDAFIGYTITITGGLGAGQSRSITTNSATVIMVGSVWSTTPDITSTYAIYGAHVKWTGWSDEISSLTLLDATIKAYAGTPTVRCDAPKRSINTMCPWNFGAYWSGQDSTNFDGFECPYQHTSTIGFSTTTTSAIDAVSDPVTFGIVDLPDSQLFHIDDEIIINSEKMRIYTVGTSALTCIRAIRGSTIATHISGATIKYSNCHYTKQACQRRGMFGNNTSDTYYVDPIIYNKNYFGGFPLLTGMITGRFKIKDLGWMRHYSVPFASNESAYSKVLPLIYGRCKLVEPPILIARNEGRASEEDMYVCALIAVGEGTLACNAINGNQDTPLNAYAVATDGLEAIYVNGKRRHSLVTGWGIFVANGIMPQIPPPFNATFGASEITSNDLGFNGTAIVMLRIHEKNNAEGSSAVDFMAGQVDAQVEVRYGRCVRVYTSWNPASPDSGYTFKATGGSPAWALLDFETSKRSGAGLAYTRVNVDSFIDLAAYCADNVDSVVDGSPQHRWTFNGCIDSKKPIQDHEHLLCLGMYCLPPYLDKDGRYKIRPLKIESLDDLPIFSSLSGTSRNILVDGNGLSTLTKVRKSLIDVPNQILVNFVAYENGEWLKTQLKLDDREAQTQLGAILGDSSLRVVSKNLDLPGVTSVDEAARIGTLVLRAGEFASGGLANNLKIEFDTLYKDSNDLELGDIIQVDDALLDPVSEIIFRVTGIDDNSISVEGGGFVFIRHVIATFHSNDIYDDTAYTCNDVTRIGGAGGFGGEAPPVTNFTVTENGVFDKNGVPHTRLTFNYNEPGRYVGRIANAGGYSAGAATIIVGGITVGKVIKQYDSITIYGQATKYYATADVTVAGDMSATIPISPVLTDDVAENTYLVVYLRAERLNFHSVVIMRSTTDGHLDPVGDWRFVEELHAAGQSVFYDISNAVEVFTALSRNLAQGTPSPETKLADGNFKYPRAAVLVDGVPDDTGPPSDWSVSLVPGPKGVNRSVRVIASHPAVNGANLLRWVWQLKNDILPAASVVWVALDSGTSPSVVYYDGSNIAHKIIDHGTKIERVAGYGFGVPGPQSMVLMDVRGASGIGWSWDVDRCQWGTVASYYKYVSGVETLCASNDAACVGMNIVGTGFRVQYTADINNVRLKIVKAIWDWNTDGYLGGTPTPIEAGSVDGEWIVFDHRATFISPPIILDSTYLQERAGRLFAQVYFENTYSVSNNSQHSTEDFDVYDTQQVPDDLFTVSAPVGVFTVRVGCIAWKYNIGIYKANLRAKFYPATSTTQYTAVDMRTVAEGGTFADNGTTQRIINDIDCNQAGCAYDLVSTEDGRWYFAYQLENLVDWSVWSDGNDVPEAVADYVDTGAADTGPPSIWTVSVAAGNAANTAVVTASRPQVNGIRIFFIAFQVKDITVGAWREIDANAGAADTLYNGSGIAHTINAGLTRITIAGGGTNFDRAQVGDLVAVDVRGNGSFDVNYCVWATVGAFEGNNASTAHYFDIQNGQVHVLSTSDIRVKIVKPPWQWTDEGYFGGINGSGLDSAEFWLENGDTSTQTFTSGEIPIPVGMSIADIGARVWFENTYSRSDDANSSGVGGGGALCVLLVDAATVVTDAALAGIYGEKLFIWSTAENRILGNPINAKCGQFLKYRIINTSSSEITITLANKWRNGKAFPVTPGPFDITETA